MSTKTHAFRMLWLLLVTVCICVVFFACSKPKTLNNTIIELAAKGDPNAQFKLGLMYAYGDGVATDPDEAKRLIRLSADAGNSAAQLSVGLEDSLVFLIGVYPLSQLEKSSLGSFWPRAASQEYQIPISYIRRAADGGHAQAQFLLGELLWLQMPADMIGARKYLARAAESGHAKAQYTLGEMEEDAHNDAACVKWFRRAAEQGLTDAQYRMGGLYYNGRKVPQDFIEAYKWLNIAAGDRKSELYENIQSARDEVAGKMTPQQIAEGQKRSSAFTPKKESKDK